MTIITLKSIKSILSTMGLLSRIGPTTGRQRFQFINYLPNVAYTIPLLTLLFPLAAYFYANMVNLIKATDAFYVIAATLMCIGQYWFLVVQKPELSHLVLRLQCLVDQSTFKWPNGSRSYFNAWISCSPFLYHFTDGRRDEPIVRCLSKCWIENIPLHQCHESICHFFVIDLPVPAIRICWCSLSDGRLSTRRLVLAVQNNVRAIFECAFANGRTNGVSNSHIFFNWIFSMPFDDTTVIGYNVAFLVQLFGSWVICAIICTVNSFFFGVCWYFEALMFDLKSIFEQINSHLVGTRHGATPVRTAIRQKLNEFIGFHVDIIALVIFPMRIWEFGIFNSVLLTFRVFMFAASSRTSEIWWAERFLWHSLSVWHGCARHCFKFMRYVKWFAAPQSEWIAQPIWFFQHVQSLDYLLLQSIMTTLALILIIFIFCYYGNMVTWECHLVSISAYDTLWYLYPIQMQKHIILIMQRSQRPFLFTGFKITICSLQSFTNVSQPPSCFTAVDATVCWKWFHLTVSPPLSASPADYQQSILVFHGFHIAELNCVRTMMAGWQLDCSSMVNVEHSNSIVRNLYFLCCDIGRVINLCTFDALKYEIKYSVACRMCPTLAACVFNDSTGERIIPFGLQATEDYKCCSSRCVEVYCFQFVCFRE